MPPVIDNLLAFLDATPTAFHTVAASADLLEQAGFTRLAECDAWDTAPGGRYYLTRNGSALIAFQMPQEAPRAARIAVAHSDSPALKLKLESAETAGDCLRIPIEVYGGPIYSTWLDKPLGVAGRFHWQSGSRHLEQLVISDLPLAVIPNPAIHLADLNNGFSYNPQEHLAAIFGSGDVAELARHLLDCDSTPPLQPFVAELFLYDATPACTVGLDQKLLQAPHLDNRCSCHAALTALINAAAQPDLLQLVAFFDNEECGSVSYAGAGGNFLECTLARLAGPAPDALPRLCAASMISSVDAAHAIHPNFPHRHDPGYAPILGKGIVLKENANQRYATDARTAAFFHDCCSRVGIQAQHFAARSDARCGSTVGPGCAARLGIPAVDLGIPMLAMHSARETAHLDDQERLVLYLQAFFA